MNTGKKLTGNRENFDRGMPFQNRVEKFIDQSRSILDMKYWIIGTLLIITILLSGCVDSDNFFGNEISTVSCTEEAKVCSDGSTVDRNAELGCEFDSCPEVENSRNCIDSDGGKNYYEEGIVNVSQEGSAGTYYDMCSDGNTLTEWNCSPGNNVESTSYVCPLGCRDNQCLQELLDPCQDIICPEGMNCIDGDCVEAS